MPSLHWPWLNNSHRRSAISDLRHRRYSSGRYCLAGFWRVARWHRRWPLGSDQRGQAFSWTLAGGLVGLPNLAGRSYAVSNSANDNGIVVGTGATTSFGSGRLPVIWQNGVVSQLPLPAGETLGDATGVNASGVAVGSVDGGSFQQGVIYSGGSATIITQTTPTGCLFVTAFGINDSGRVVGFGIDPGNAARNVGIVYDIGAGSAFEVGALPGFNGALAFGVSNGGHVVGSSMLNQGSGLPFIWSDAGGIVADSAGRRHKPGLRASGELGRLGGGPGFVGVLDSIPV